MAGTTASLSIASIEAYKCIHYYSWWWGSYGLDALIGLHNMESGLDDVGDQHGCLRVVFVLGCIKTSPGSSLAL